MGITQKTKATLLFLVLIGFSSIGYGQSETEISLLKLMFLPEHHSSDHTEHLKNSDSEIKVISSSLFVFYKEFLSSQDIDACVFTPSCSEYTIAAISKKGIFGVFDGLDRLMRCHPLANQKNYPYDPKTSKLYDPY